MSSELLMGLDQIYPGDWALRLIRVCGQNLHDHMGALRVGTSTEAHYSSKRAKYPRTSWRAWPIALSNRSFSA